MHIINEICYLLNELCLKFLKQKTLFFIFYLLHQVTGQSHAIVMLGLNDLTLETIRDLQLQNFSVCVQEVNSAWLMSYLWAAGVECVTSHNLEQLLKMEEPLWDMSKEAYMALWISVDTVSVLLIILIFIIQRIQLYGSQFAPEAISLHSAAHRLGHRPRAMKEKLLREGGIIEALDGPLDDISEARQTPADDTVSGAAGDFEPVYAMESVYSTVNSMAPLQAADANAAAQITVTANSPVVS